MPHIPQRKKHVEEQVHQGYRRSKYAVPIVIAANLKKEESMNRMLQM
jgi:hypothetical protein